MLNFESLIASKYPHLLPLPPEVRLFRLRFSTEELLAYGASGWHPDESKLADAVSKRFLFVAKEKFKKPELERLRKHWLEKGEAGVAQEQESAAWGRGLAGESVSGRCWKSSAGEGAELTALRDEIVARACALFEKNMEVRDRLRLPECYEDRRGFLTYERALWQKYFTWSIAGRGADGAGVIRVNLGAVENGRIVAGFCDIIQKNAALREQMKAEGYGEEVWGKIGLSSIPKWDGTGANSAATSLTKSPPGPSKSGDSTTSTNSLAKHYAPASSILAQFPTLHDQIVYNFTRCLYWMMDLNHKIVNHDYSRQTWPTSARRDRPVAVEDLDSEEEVKDRRILDQTIFYYCWKGVTFSFGKNYRYWQVPAAGFGTAFYNTTRATICVNLGSEIVRRLAVQGMKALMTEMAFSKVLLPSSSTLKEELTKTLFPRGEDQTPEGLGDRLAAWYRRANERADGGGAGLGAEELPAPTSNRANGFVNPTTHKLSDPYMPQWFRAYHGWAVPSDPDLIEIPKYAPTVEDVLHWDDDFYDDGAGRTKLRVALGRFHFQTRRAETGEVVVVRPVVDPNSVLLKEGVANGESRKGSKQSAGSAGSFWSCREEGSEKGNDRKEVLVASAYGSGQPKTESAGKRGGLRCCVGK